MSPPRPSGDLASAPGAAGAGALGFGRQRRRAGPDRGRLSCLARRAWFAGCVCLVTAAPVGAATFAEWAYRQEVRISAPGLVKLSLPADTLDAALPGLEDLRILDGAGAEVPYVIERPVPPAGAAREAKSFQAALTPTATILTMETGLLEPLDGVTLEPTASNFIKAARVEGSADGKTWQTLAQGAPVFLQPGGASRLHIPLPAGAWTFLRLTVDDRRSPPVPFTGAQVQAAAPEAAPSEPLEVRIVEPIEAAGETRLTLRLPGARLHLAALQIESPDPLFTRRVTLAARQVEEDAVREKPLAEGTIYRIAVPGRPAANQLALPLDLVIPSRELLLLIRNDDSPPLRIAAVTAHRRPVYAILMVRQVGPHVLLTGNRRARAPRYDLAALGANLRAAEVSRVFPSPLAPNPDFRPAEPLPEIGAIGSPLDVSAWPYRKRTQQSGTGVQQLEIDLEVLTHTQANLADLRLVSNGRQLPYLTEHTSLSRVLIPQVTAGSDPRSPKVSRWTLTLPYPRLPVIRLRCTSPTPVFRREVVLYEEAPDERGAKHRRPLGRVSWVQTPDRQSKELVLSLPTTPATDVLILETDNGDNPPIELRDCAFSYVATRLLFKGAPDAYLYYGNRRAASPRYDVSLVAEQVLAADKAVASVGPEERVGKGAWPERVALTGKGGVIFWTMLAVVVAVLLLIISRLLPKSPPPAG